MGAAPRIALALTRCTASLWWISWSLRKQIGSKTFFFFFHLSQTARLLKRLTNITEPIKAHICFIKGPHIHPSYLSISSLTTCTCLITCFHACVTVQINWAYFTSFQGKRKLHRLFFLSQVEAQFLLLPLKVTFASKFLFNYGGGEIGNKAEVSLTEFAFMSQRMIESFFSVSCSLN